MPQTGTKTKDRIGTYIEQFFRRKDIFYFVCHTQLQACFVLPSYVLVFGHQIIIMLPFSNSSAITALLRLKLNHCKTNANDTYTIIYPYSCSTFPFHSFHRAQWRIFLVQPSKLSPKYGIAGVQLYFAIGPRFTRFKEVQQETIRRR